MDKDINMHMNMNGCGYDYARVWVHNMHGGMDATRQPLKPLVPYTETGNQNESKTPCQ